VVFRVGPAPKDAVDDVRVFLLLLQEPLVARGGKPEIVVLDQDTRVGGNGGNRVPGVHARVLRS